jgi:hypothetical protein
LAWNRGGLVIDPGYDFLSNAFSMRSLRFSARDFDAALVSHAHDDHTQDLEPLLSLQYRLRRDTSGTRPRFSDFPVVCSEGVRWKYGAMSAANSFLRLLPIIPTENARRILGGTPAQDFGDPFFAGTGIKISAIVGYHTERPWHLHNTGITVKLYCDGPQHQVCLGYTSDTGFEPELVDFFADADLLLLHLGNKTDRGRPPRHHLGENGCVNLISAVKRSRPRLFLLGEFGAEEFIASAGDDRIRYTAYIEQMAGLGSEDKRVLPADIGLRVHLPDLHVWCERTWSLRRPTADNPMGVWRPFQEVIPEVDGSRQIHYTVI